jgi:hypothetical protein
MKKQNRPSPLELAKRLKAIKDITDSDGDLTPYIDSLLLPDETIRVQEIMAGFSHEDSFALLARLMSTCETLSPLGQTPIIENSQALTPDFLAVFRPSLSLFTRDVKFPANCYSRCLIEVKGKSEGKFGISKKDLERRMCYAELVGLPLVLAVRFTRFAGDLWLLVEPEVYQKLGRKLRPEDLQLGIGHILFDDYFIAVKPDLKIRVVFEAIEGGSPVSEYGTIRELTFLIDNIELCSLSGDCNFVYVVLGCFDKKSVELKEEGQLTKVTYEVPPQGRTILNIMTYMNERIGNPDSTDSIDKGRILARLDSHQKPYLIPRKLVESVFLKYHPAFIRLAFESQKSLFAKYERIFGIKWSNS